MSNINIRDCISSILNENFGKTYNTKLEADKASFKLLERLQKTFPGNIKVEPDVNKTIITRKQDIFIINCYTYAFGLANSEAYKNNLGKKWYFLNGRRKCGVLPEFVSWCIENQYLQKIDDLFEGCMVLYFHDDTPVHAAVLLVNDKEDNNKIVKGRWGSFEAIIIHNMWHVGINYGNNVKYYMPLTTQESEEYFQKFLEMLEKCNQKN